MLEDKRNREIANFYRVEFQRHRYRLNQHKNRYGEATFKEVDEALGRLLGELDHIVRLNNFEELAGQLLAKIDSITHLYSSRRTSSTVH